MAAQKVAQRPEREDRMISDIKDMYEPVSRFSKPPPSATRPRLHTDEIHIDHGNIGQVTVARNAPKTPFARRITVRGGTKSGTAIPHSFRSMSFGAATPAGAGLSSAGRNTGGRSKRATWRLPNGEPRKAELVSLPQPMESRSKARRGIGSEFREI